MDTLLRKLGIALPIVQAPMAGISTPEMAAAVSNAGALGSIGIGSVDAEAARKMIVEVRGRTDRPFQVNVFCHRPALADAAREAAWLARLTPEFARYGAKPPTRLTEVYQSFLTDDTKLAMLTSERRRSLAFTSACPTASASRRYGPPVSCFLARPRILPKRRRLRRPESMPSLRKATKPAAIAACLSPACETIDSALWL